MPDLYIIAGPTTAAKTLLPDVFHCTIFINADEIAAQLNPTNVEAVAFQAGRMMLEQIQIALTQKETFVIETTLATRSYLNLVKRAQLLNYEVVLIFFYRLLLKWQKKEWHCVFGSAGTTFQRR